MAGTDGTVSLNVAMSLARPHRASIDPGDRTAPDGRRGGRPRPGSPRGGGRASRDRAVGHGHGGRSRGELPGRCVPGRAGYRAQRPAPLGLAPAARREPRVDRVTPRPPARSSPPGGRGDAERGGPRPGSGDARSGRGEARGRTGNWSGCGRRRAAGSGSTMDWQSRPPTSSVPPRRGGAILVGPVAFDAGRGGGHGDGSEACPRMGPGKPPKLFAKFAIFRLRPPPRGFLRILRILRCDSDPDEPGTRAGGTGPLSPPHRPDHRSDSTPSDPETATFLSGR
jgi:hypothetical protein